MTDGAAAPPATAPSLFHGVESAPICRQMDGVRRAAPVGGLIDHEIQRVRPHPAKPLLLDYGQHGGGAATSHDGSETGLLPVTASSPAIRLANAPVSYGVFELTAGGSELPDPDRLLARVHQAGYAGVDLGPLGYLGEGNALAARLRSHDLLISGGWVQLRFSEPACWPEDLAALDRALDAFTAAAAGVEPPWRPKPTLADAGSDVRRANPGGGQRHPDIGLDDAGWRRLAEGVQRAADRCRARGLEPTFHHHASTHVEAPREIERLLALTDVDLCFDTGHVLIGGGDPVAALRAWRPRVNHVHLKDARRDVLDAVIAERAGMRAVWERGAFCEFGAGDVDVDACLAILRDTGYAGWLVVEQDRIPAPGEPVDVAAAAQQRNRAYLSSRDL